MIALASLMSLVSLGCLLFTVYKMYQSEGVLRAVLGFICALYGFIWGWMHNKEHENLSTVMYVWTGAIIASMVFQILGGAFSNL